MAKKDIPTLAERIQSFIARPPSLAEARAQLAATESKIADTRAQLDAALKAEEQALIAVSAGMVEAATARDAARRDARRLKDDLHDLEKVLSRQQQRLADAEVAERAAANAATWEEFEKIAGRREAAATRCDAAVVELAAALVAVQHETALLTALMGGAGQHLRTGDIRANLRATLIPSLDGMASTVPTRTAAEIVADQNESVRLNVQV